MCGIGTNCKVIIFTYCGGNQLRAESHAVPYVRASKTLSCLMKVAALATHFAVCPSRCVKPCPNSNFSLFPSVTLCTDTTVLCCRCVCCLDGALLPLGCGSLSSRDGSVTATHLIEPQSKSSLPPWPTFDSSHCHSVMAQYCFFVFTANRGQQ